MEITLALSTLAFSFLFSGMEAAFLSASLLKIELRLHQNDRAAQLLSHFKQNRSSVLITLLIGNSLALVVFVLTFSQLLQPWLSRMQDPATHGLAFFLALSAIATLVVLVVAEYIPKAFFRSNADRLVFPSAYVLSFFYYLLYIPVWGANKVSRFFLRVFFRVNTADRVITLDKRDLDDYIQELTSKGNMAPELDSEMLNNALALKDTRARECMIPRTEVVAVSLDTGMEELMDEFIETQLSKLMVYQGSLDHIQGYVHSNSMFHRPGSISEVLQPVLVIPESMPADKLLEEFISNKRTVAIVVDEFGGTAGIVTIEDLVEELFGEIEDEHDETETGPVEEDLLEIRNEDGSYILGARLEIAYLNEEYTLGLPESEFYTTLGGWIMYESGSIPARDQTLKIGHYDIRIVHALHHRLISLSLKPRLSA
ncbi:MAG: HlyC/CorC family transporter [Bacteroidetes bacterium]|nr:MAG: HlyC/CorC family transporter [Bacteroidota bacterium]